MSHRFSVARSMATLSLLVISVLTVAAVGAQTASAGAGVDLNTADAATLARELKGIGLSKARAIVEHRRRHGPFRSVEELALVRGIGPKTVERNRASLRVGGTGPAGSASAAAGRGGGAGARPGARSPSPPRDEEPVIIEGMPR